MKKYNGDKVKAFFISLALHSSLAAALIYSSTVDIIEPVAQKESVMSVSLMAVPKLIEQPKVAPKPTPTPPKPVVKKPVQTPAKVAKAIPKPVQKQVIKENAPKKELVKPEPVEEIAQEENLLAQEDVNEPQELVNDALLAEQTPSNATPTEQTPNDALSKEANEQVAQKEVEITPNQLSEIRTLIQNSLIYPSMARRLKIEGTVVVEFVLSGDGKVESATVLTRSGNSSLDAKALETVLALSGEYPQLQRKIDLKIPISFSLKNS